MMDYLYQLVAVFSSTSMLTICLAAIVFVLLCWKSILEKHRYPPGPIPLPIIGNDYAMFAEQRAQYRYNNWRRYGTVVSYISIGAWNVQLFGYDAIHEAFVKNADHCSDRISSRLFAKYVKDGLIFGDRWKDLRKQALMVLRDHGMGKVKIEAKIREELEYNFDMMSTLKGRQSSKTFASTVGMAVFNLINQIAFGRRLEYSDSSFVALQKFEPFFFATLKSSVIPFYKHWPCDPLRLKEYTDYFNQVVSFIENEIQQHKAALDVDQPRDFIDSFLAEGVKTGDPLFTDEGELKATIIQLFIGGFDTTTTTLTWALLFLVNYPSDQQRLLEEINQVIGNRPVTVADRESMHFTQSFINEVLRMGSAVSSAITHCCTEDVVIQGHRVPKGTKIVANLYSTLRDETVYPNPHTFIADRFLNDNGEFVKPTGKQMLPFSIGRRVCPGEALARTELFMILVGFIQRFKVSRVSAEKVREDGIDVFSHSPRPFEYIMEPRT